MFRWREGATDDQKRAARDALAALRDKVPTVRALTVGFDIRRNPRNWDMLLSDAEGNHGQGPDALLRGRAGASLRASIRRRGGLYRAAEGADKKASL
jgi:hypothetical protein